jgi:hypothetical protein
MCMFDDLQILLYGARHSRFLSPMRPTLKVSLLTMSKTLLSYILVYELNQIGPVHSQVLR